MVMQALSRKEAQALRKQRQHEQEAKCFDDEGLAPSTQLINLAFTAILNLFGFLFGLFTLVTFIYGVLYKFTTAFNNFCQATIGIFVFSADKGTMGTWVIRVFFAPFGFAIGWMLVLVATDLMARIYNRNYEHGYSALGAKAGRGPAWGTQQDRYRDRRSVHLRRRKALTYDDRVALAIWERLFGEEQDSGSGSEGDYMADKKAKVNAWEMEFIDDGL